MVLVSDFYRSIPYNFLFPHLPSSYLALMNINQSVADIFTFDPIKTIKKTPHE